ncbi:MAG: hypothetical protein ABI411_14515 [Tahibacter sp.]
MKPVVFASILAALGGCATTGPANSGGKATKAASALEERVAQRWEFLIAHKAESAYDFLTPGFRATKTREVYAFEMNNRPVTWTGASVTEKECDDEDSCTVSVSMRFTVPVHGGSPNTPGFSVAHEKWIKVSGKWYYLPDQIGSSVLKKG